jgi:hypothetical protein
MKEEIIKAKFTLKQAGYFVDNLWHIDDVKNATEVSLSTDQAMQVLNMSLTNEATMDQIWFAIKMSIDILNEKP